MGISLALMGLPVSGCAHSEDDSVLAIRMLCPLQDYATIISACQKGHSTLTNQYGSDRLRGRKAINQTGGEHLE